MTRKTSIFAAVAVLGIASFAAADTNGTLVVFSGGHEPARQIRVQPQSTMAAPYALTGSDRMQKSVRAENIWVGSRIVGARVVSQ